MKHLDQYILEAISGNQQYFMVDFEANGKTEGVEEYLKRNRLLTDDGKIVIKYGKSKGKYFTLDDLRMIYTYAEENHMSCPMIVDYKRKPGHFVLRRWVARLNDQLDGIDLMDDVGAPFDGLHNTNLKEDGKWFPTAEDYESVIAYAYNKIHGFFKTDPENILYVTGRELESGSKAEQLMEYYAGNQEEIDGIVANLPNDCGKMKKLPAINKTTDEWSELGEYDKSGRKPNNTPKTDVESNKYHISFKEAGGSQLMSGCEQEAHATLMAAAKKMNDDTIIKRVESLFDEHWLRNINSIDDIDRRLLAQKRNRSYTTTIRKLFENPEFKRLVMIEATSGETKFGKGASSTADHIFVWNPIKPDDSRFYTMDGYINSILSRTDTTISLKTASRTSTAMRIITK